MAEHGSKQTDYLADKPNAFRGLRADNQMLGMLHMQPRSRITPSFQHYLFLL